MESFRTHVRSLMVSYAMPAPLQARGLPLHLRRTSPASRLHPPSALGACLPLPSGVARAGHRQAALRPRAASASSTIGGGEAHEAPTARRHQARRVTTM